MSTRTALTGTAAEVRALVTDALDVYGDDPDARATLTALSRRLDEPLRVAVAGMVKAGKSTLINAFVGEEIAPTDAGECTRVVTWYRYGPVPRVTLHPVTGPARPLPVRRRDGRLLLDLDGGDPADVDHLVVEWPTRSLEDLVLIDTPGTESVSTGVSARTTAALTPQEVPAEADAVIYLMRHLRSVDVAFLEAFRDATGEGGAANAVAVLSRADEIGAGRLDALIAAGEIAGRLRDGGALRELAVGIVPVAGLLAQSARTLRQGEVDLLVRLAAQGRAATEEQLLSADRFRRAGGPEEEAQRDALLDRLGVFGIRLALVLVRNGVTDPTRLAYELARRSGLGELVRLVETQLLARADDLKTRTAVVAVERLLRSRPREGTNGLHRSLERVRAGAHELTELTLLAQARTTGLDLPGDRVSEAERLLGGRGTAPADRLGLDADAPEEVLRAEALDRLREWRTLAASPFTTRDTADVCVAVARSCEGILAAVTVPVGGWRPLPAAEPGTGGREQADDERRAG